MKFRGAQDSKKERLRPRDFPTMMKVEVALEVPWSQVLGLVIRIRSQLKLSAHFSRRHLTGRAAASLAYEYFKNRASG